MNLRILIVDDSELTRRILRAIVHSREWTVCAEADQGADGVRLFEELRPDIVVIDLALPDINGLNVARQMAAVDPTYRLSYSQFWMLRASKKRPVKRGFAARSLRPKPGIW